jgi:hypothetical protein
MVGPQGAILRDANCFPAPMHSHDSSPYQIRFQELIGSSLIGTACSKAFWSTSAGALAQAIINVDNWTAMKVLQVPIYI